jgi:hypothetical protein
MEYMILDDGGNALAAFADETTARATLHAIVRAEPEAVDYVVLLAYDDDGMPVGEAMRVADVPAPFTVEPSQFLLPRLTDALVRQIPRTSTRYVAMTSKLHIADVTAARPAV